MEKNVFPKICAFKLFFLIIGFEALINTATFGLNPSFILKELK